MRNTTTDNIYKRLGSFYFNPDKKTNWIFLFLLLSIVWYWIGNIVVTDNQDFSTRKLTVKNIAVILKVQGNISLVRGNSTITKRIIRGTCLKYHDTLITDKNSFVTIRFIEDSDLLRIRPNSICVFNDNEVKNEVINTIYFELESILARVIRQTPVMRVVTPTSVAAVK